MLQAHLDVSSVDMNDPDRDFPGEFGRFLARERHRAFTHEVERRTRILGMPALQVARGVQDHAEREELTQAIRETVDVPSILSTIGWHMTASDTSRRSGAREYHSDCPVCRAGVDRLVSRGGANGRCWCRVCGWSADAIAQSVLPGCDQFRDALKVLAGIAAQNQVMT